MEAFQRFVGRDRDPDLAAMRLKGVLPRRGKELFLATDTQNGSVVAGKCQLCHANGGAKTPQGANSNFATGVENLVDQPADLADAANNPPDGGFGITKVNGVPGFGDGKFNTPPLVEAADTGPFFHNNAIETIEGAVAFYDGDAFNKSPAGQLLAQNDPRGVGIRLDATQVVAVAAFLRVINALENIRQSLDLLESSGQKGFWERAEAKQLLRRAMSETDDTIRVLKGGGLHPDAVVHLQEARAMANKAARSLFGRRGLITQAIERQRNARAHLVEPF